MKGLLVSIRWYLEYLTGYLGVAGRKLAWQQDLVYQDSSDPWDPFYGDDLVYCGNPARSQKDLLELGAPDLGGVAGGLGRQAFSGTGWRYSRTPESHELQ